MYFRHNISKNNFRFRSTFIFKKKLNANFYVNHLDYSITKVMILTLILLNKTLFEAKWKCHLLETMAPRATFDFSVLSVVCDPGQSTSCRVKKGN